MVGEQCHAVRLRLSGAQAEPERLTALLAAFGGRLWTEELPVTSADPRASARRAAELGRWTGTVRGVLMRYRDSVADLVVVAHRAVLDRGQLADLSAAVTTGREAVPGAAPREPVVVAAAPAPDWGSGRTGEPGWEAHRLDLPDADPADTDGWLAAIALTLHRYAGHDAPDTVTFATDRRGARELAVPTDSTLDELRAAVGGAASANRPVLVGLIEPDGPAEAVALDPDGYLPCLAPPFPLTLALLPLPGGGTRLWAGHLRSHLGTETAAVFLRHLVHVRQQIATAPETLVADAELLDTAEQDRVARLGRPAVALDSRPLRLADAFSRMVSAQPDAVAVSDGETVLTYRELDERADRLAKGLLAHGVAAGDMVGICLDRTTELVTAMVGVLKAGAAYVPTDPAYPAERLIHTAEDAGLTLVITRSPEYPVEAGTAVTPDALLSAPECALPFAGTPDDPAYVIFTSGSTGRPKGVVIPHRNVVALVDATRDEYGLGAQDTWTFFHSGAFDFSVWEIWGCLLTGGRLIVVPYLVSREPEDFRDLLVREQVTVLSQTPSAFSQLLEIDHGDVAVRLVVFGGEPLDARTLLGWFDRHPESRCRVVNMFGITETTVHVTAQTLTRAHAVAGSRSVGPALPGWHLYVTDPRGRLVPPGVTGEIRVGGAGVALGYLDRPELTAARFVDDPYAQGRCYLSGDLGRLRPDGTLEHLGRIDSQVKIRGFRIELDEIRSVLLEDPDVRAAAVVVRRGDAADPASARLDAYVVPADLDIAALRKRAAAVLPGYMLPATIIALDSLPLTINGKLDTARLPVSSDPADRPATSLVEAAADPADRSAVLTEIWSTVLGIPVGLDDDFFELGGNSLFAVRINSALRACGLPAVPLRDLFRTPTIRELTGTTAAG